MQVRPALFLVFSVLDKKAQVTFFGKNGLFLSYTADSLGVSLVYANTSYTDVNTTSNAITFNDLVENHPTYKWYSRRVDESTGLPYGEAVILTPFPYWDVEPVKSSLHRHYGAPSLDHSIIDRKEVLFSFASSVQGSHFEDPFGAISIGAPFTKIGTFFDRFDLQGGVIYLATVDGHLLAQSGGAAGLFKGNGSQVLQFATESDNDVVAAAASYIIPHLPYILGMKSESFAVANVDLHGKHYMIESSPIHISGATMVCFID